MSVTPAAAQSSEGQSVAAPAALPTELAIHDWLVLAYVVVLNVAVLRGDGGGDLKRQLAPVLGLLTCAFVGIGIGRSNLFRDGWLKASMYRVAIYGPVQLSYFFFRELLPHINPRSLDHELRVLDIQLFGVEPALVLERTLSPATTEWFSFFYFGYFFVLAVHVVPILFLSKNQRLLGEFALGMIMLFCIGHTVYMIVPGFGPYRAMADEFSRPFPHGLWLDTVMDTVRSGGAQKDIFPSLHTAAPAFIALFSFRHRKLPPYRYSWPIVAFFSLNIMIATMFLRWHYLIDVVAGLLLATLTAGSVPFLVDWDLRRRRSKGLTLLWPKFTRERR
ncbi:MAG: phosphatase PAP2 family protein [Polyangiaceae bacterium]